MNRRTLVTIITAGIALCSSCKKSSNTHAISSQTASTDSAVFKPHAVAQQDGYPFTDTFNGGFIYTSIEAVTPAQVKGPVLFYVTHQTADSIYITSNTPISAYLNANGTYNLAGTPYSPHVRLHTSGLGLYNKDYVTLTSDSLYFRFNFWDGCKVLAGGQERVFQGYFAGLRSNRLARNN